MADRHEDLVKRTFQEALDRAPDERAAFVASACAGDERARDRVMALLSAYAEADGFLTSPESARGGVTGAADPASHGAGQYVGTTIGPYKVLQLIGEGGFGAVYMAAQEEPIRRRVALKLIKVGMDTKQVIARFEAERQALAMMEHPNIARVLDAGATETGRPYFVMELVRGIPITEFCDENRLSTRERLSLVADVCAAVQHAHQKGVIHRDIKPSNVLVTMHDDRPVPKVIDFGVARATDHRLTERTLFTEFGQFIGTPMYMSPEQASMSGLDIDTRSDIYSLGVLLYELLTGTTPYTAGQLRHVAYIEILRMLREVEPPRPSMRLSQLGESAIGLAKLRGSEPGALERLLRGDLDWIVMKALEKDRTRRYASASELSADIARYFGGDPVSAGPPGAGYRLRKLVRKHRGKAAATAAVVAAIVLGGLAATWQGVRASASAERARASAILTSAVATGDPLLKALLIDEIADMPELPGKLAVLRQVANHPLPISVVHGPDLANNVEYSPDGRYLAAAFMDGTARIWRTDGTGEPLDLPHGDEVDALAFSPESDRIVTGTSDGVVRVWPVDGGDPVVLTADLRIESTNFSPDGRLVSAGTEQGGPIWIWSADGRDEPVVIEVSGQDLLGGKFFPDGGRILTGGSDAARIWRTDGTGPIAVFPGVADGWVYAGMSPDGRRIAVSGGGKVSVYSADIPGPPIVLDHPGATSWMSRGFTGELLTTASPGGIVKIWHLDRPDEPVTLRHSAHAWGRTSRDGSRVFTTSTDGKVRVWFVDGRGPELLFAGPAGQGNGGVRQSPDGTQITADFLDGTVRTWLLAESGEALVLKHEVPVNALAFSPDGRQIATGAADGIVRIWSADGSGGPILLEGHERSDRISTPLPWSRRPDGVSSVRFSPDGRRLVTASPDGTARIWAADGSGEPIVLEHGAFAHDAAFSPDGDAIVTGGRDGRVLIWPSDGSGEQASVVAEHRDWVESVSFSPDGRRVLSASETATVTHVEGMEEPIAVRGSYFVSDAEFSPDGDWVVIGSESGDVRVFPVHGEADPIALRGEKSHISSVAFSPEGDRVVAGTRDGNVRIWRVDGSEEPLELNGHYGPVTGVAFSPDGTRVATSSLDGTVRIWRVTWPELLEYVRANLRACLTPEQRMRYLVEAERAANAASAACERRLRGF